MKQYKLYEIYNTDLNKRNNLEKLLVGRELIFFSDSLVCVEYDYINIEYKDLFNIMKEVNYVSPCIITSKMFLKFLKNFIEENLLIKDINFLKCIYEEEQIKVNKLLKKINRSSEKDRIGLISCLFEELEWLYIDECIDIEQVSIMKDIDGLKYTLELYQNGIIFTNHQYFIEYLAENKKYEKILV